MQKNKSTIKNKIVNNLLKNGKKNTSEKILLKSVKELQKNSTKQSKELIQLALLNLAPTFKLLKISNKKRKKKKSQGDLELPVFISNNESRISLAIKYLIKTAQSNNLNKFHLKLIKEFIASTTQQSEAITLKKQIQKKALTKKYFFRYFKNR